VENDERLICGVMDACASMRETIKLADRQILFLYCRWQPSTVLMRLDNRAVLVARTVDWIVSKSVR